MALYPNDDGELVEHPVGLVVCSNDEYHAGPGISKSHLDAIANGSPLHYWHKYINPNRVRNQPTPAMVMGSAVHSAILEPDLFPTEYVESPGFDRRTKIGKEEAERFENENAGKTVLSAADYSTCLAVRDAVRRHPVAAGLLANGKSEQSFYAIDKDTTQLIKCRTDYIHDNGDMIVDVKTTSDASPSGFGKSAANFRYVMQTAWYNHVLDMAFNQHPATWVFLAVETTPPYGIGIYYTEPDQVALAAVAARRHLHTITECKISGLWPDYGHEPQPLMLPAWARF